MKEGELGRSLAVLAALTVVVLVSCAAFTASLWLLGVGR